MPDEITPLESALPRGRGTGANPTNRFTFQHYAIDPDIADSTFEDDISPRTQFFRDTARSALARNHSPDIGFEVSLNPYRGCEHGCIYCYARPTHEFLGLSAGLDFETKIFVKEEAPSLLRDELASSKWKPQVVSISGVTDPYQPVERRLGLTRRCLEVFAEFRNPVFIITKNALVTRDAELLSEMATRHCAGVMLSITTLDPNLCGVMEPRTSRPALRLTAIERLVKSGIPVGVLIAPVIPGLTEHEMMSILKAAANHGASFAGYVPVRLPLAVADLFEKWLDAHFPSRKKKVLNRIRELRGGKLNDPRFGSRMRGEGIWAEQLKMLFHVARRQAGIGEHGPELTIEHFGAHFGEHLGGQVRRPTRCAKSEDQLSLF